MKNNQVFIHKVIHIFITFVLMATVIVYAKTSCNNLYKVTATQLNVRDQASVSGSIVGILYKDDQVCISQERKNWGKANSGWVSKKHLLLLNNTSQNYMQTESTVNGDTSNDGSGMVVGLGILIVLAFVFFALKTLFYHTLISLGMAEPDGRAKNGIRLTRLGKFIASISGLIIFFLFMLIGSMSK